MAKVEKGLQVVISF